jgi:hypothetical protein
MQHVARLVFPDSLPRMRWSLPPGLIAVLCSGPFGTGNSRTYREQTSIGLQEYRRRVDRLGQATESVTLKGQPLVIDANVRAWIDRMDARASTVAAPPAARLPPTPPAAPELPIAHGSSRP